MCLLFSGMQSKSTYTENFASNQREAGKNSKLNYCSVWHSKGDPLSPCHLFFLLVENRSMIIWGKV